MFALQVRFHRLPLNGKYIGGEHEDFMLGEGATSEDIVDVHATDEEDLRYYHSMAHCFMQETHHIAF